MQRVINRSYSMTIDHLFHRHKSICAERPTEWSDTLKSWCVFKPLQVKQLLDTTAAVVPPYADQLAPLQKKFNFDLSGTTRVLAHIPLANEGDQHTSSRRDIAKLHNATYDERLAKLKTEISVYAPVFHKEGQVDLTHEFFHPIISKITAPFEGTCLKQTWPGPSQLFDRFLSLNRRKLIYSQINSFYEAEEHQTDLQLDQRIALRILGYDALLGTIQESFILMIERNKSLKPNQIEWPSTFPASAVPTVERIANMEINLDGKLIQKGERIRLFLSNADGNEELYFGSGRHKCIGAGISQKIWREFTKFFAGIDRKIKIEKIEYPESDFVFNCPSKIFAKIE